MISVLIPVYNVNVQKLVQDLDKQLQSISQPYEIICVDDGSDNLYKELNRKITLHPSLLYEELEHNIGRSAIRNLLASKAKHSCLLFLDCDVAITDDNFIQKYVEAYSENSVWYGGCVYSSFPPKNMDYVLHWKYGRTIENPALAIRIKDPHKYFHTVNFCCSKHILLTYPFDETIREYGHEDFLWAQVLHTANIPIIHIDNPVLHEGLSDTTHFLRKTSDAVENLVQLENKNIICHTSLQKFYHRLHGFRMDIFYFFFYKIFEKIIVQQLYKKQPRLFFLQLYKLGIYCRFKIHKKRV